MLNSIVRDALLTSVTCTRAAGQLPDQPRVDRAERELPRLRLPRAPGTLSSIHRILRRREIRVDHQARLRWIICSCACALEPVAEAPPCAGPATRSRCRSAAPSRGPTRTVVSRWLVMPMAAMSRRVEIRRRSALRPRRRSAKTRSRRGSCSTHPGCGKICRNSRCAMDRSIRVIEHNRPRTRRALVQR